MDEEEGIYVDIAISRSPGPMEEGGDVAKEETEDDVLWPEDDVLWPDPSPPGASTGALASPVTFAFDLGALRADAEIETIDVRLSDTWLALGRRSVACNGRSLGSLGDGEVRPARLAEGAVVDRLALGVGSADEAVLRDLWVDSGGAREKVEKVETGADGGGFDGPSYAFDRRRLGLNLWITSAAADRRGGGVVRYGFVLSADPSLVFDPAEFKIFWRFLVDVRHKSAPSHTTRSQTNQAMSARYSFLRRSFEGGTIPAGRGIAYATRSRACLVQDIFSYTISGELRPVLFVNGRPFDIAADFGRTAAAPEQLTALALATALQDEGLLHAANIVAVGRDGSHREDFARGADELLPLQKDAMHRDDYNPTPIVGAAVRFLAEVGMRQVSEEAVMASTADHWDVYLVAAGSEGYWNFPTLAAAVCAVLQISAPVLLVREVLAEALRAEDEAPAPADVSLKIFVLMACLSAVAHRGADGNGNAAASRARLRRWLLLLPEFQIWRIYAGICVRQTVDVLLSAAAVIVLRGCDTVAAAILRALALYALGKMDAVLVGDNALSTLRERQRAAGERLRATGPRANAGEAEEAGGWAGRHRKGGVWRIEAMDLAVSRFTMGLLLFGTGYLAFEFFLEAVIDPTIFWKKG